MDLQQLRCFVAIAEELHFGRAAQKMDMLPASFGRHIRLLEEDLGRRLVERTTRNVALTPAGASIIEDARRLVEQADALASRFRQESRQEAAILRVGAIDSAAAGLMPLLMQHFRERYPDVEVRLHEDKTVRLLPRLLSGRLDLAFVRPPDLRDPRIHYRTLFWETAVVALPADHRLAGQASVAVHDLDGEPLIVPDRRSRPHSHDLTIKLFLEAGLTAQIAQLADEKQTIVNLVSTGLGVAIVPQWISRMATPGVRYVPLDDVGGARSKLALAAAWLRGARDPARDRMIEVLDANLATYAALA